MPYNPAVFPEFAGLYARKSGNTSRTTTTVFQDDPDLTLTLPANGVYEWDIMFEVQSPTATPDFKMNFTIPSGSFGTGWFLKAGSGLSGTPSDNKDNFSWDDMIPAGRIIFMTGSGDLVVRGEGIITVNTGGTFALKWAQNTSSGDATIVSGHWLRARKIVSGGF